jgi:hypothetical protein
MRLKKIIFAVSLLFFLFLCQAYSQPNPPSLPKRYWKLNKKQYQQNDTLVFTLINRSGKPLFYNSGDTTCCLFIQKIKEFEWLDPNCGSLGKNGASIAVLAPGDTLIIRKVLPVKGIYEFNVWGAYKNPVKNKRRHLWVKNRSRWLISVKFKV